jgi:hypothetical protein
MNNKSMLAYFNKNWSDLAPDLLDIKDTVPKKLLKRTCKSIWRFYLGRMNLNSTTVKQLVKVLFSTFLNIYKQIEIYFAV